jgi:hypothetical protein
LPTMLRVVEAVANDLANAGFRSWVYKTIPAVYHKHPAEEDRYALFLMNAATTRRDVLSVVPVGSRLPYQGRRDRGIKKARAAGVTVQEDSDVAGYWELLSETLSERFTAAPVHTLDEMTRLRERFPGNIRLFTARRASLLAGVVIYESDRVAHCQYIAASPDGRAVGALDLLFDHLLNVVYRDHPYFDFGSSHEAAGRAVNLGLIDQKEGFGARSVVHDHFEVDLTVPRPGPLTGARR